MPTRIIYKRRKEKERRLAKLLLIATAVLAIGGAGIAACFTAIMHVDAAARLRCDRKSRRRCGMPRQFTAGRNSALDFSE